MDTIKARRLLPTYMKYSSLYWVSSIMIVVSVVNVLVDMVASKVEAKHHNFENMAEILQRIVSLRQGF